MLGITFEEAIAPLFQQHLEAAKQQGQEEGQRMILESFLQVRFGESEFCKCQ